MDFLQTIFYFILTIFVLVSIHEFGHFIAARIFGMYVPVYSIGMGRRLFGWNKLNGFTFGPLSEELEAELGKHTDYRLSLLPIGGYAKIAGMIDETQREELTGPAQQWEFRSKSWWKKSIVICAGVTLNFLLAGAIFIGLKYSEGKIIWNTTTVGYVAQQSVSAKLGIVPGDKIVSIDGKPMTNWQDVDIEATIGHLGRDFAMTLERAGTQFTVQYHTSDLTTEPAEVDKNFGLYPEGAGGAFVNDVTSSYPADHAGIKTGDRVIKINDVPVLNEVAMIDLIKPHANQPINLTWIRDGKEMSTSITPNNAGQIGVQISQAPFMGKTTKLDYSFGEAISTGISDLFTQTRLYIQNIFMLFTGKVNFTKNVGGPIRIAQIAGHAAKSGAAAYLGFMAILSLSLAFLNILPVPALDGGHLIIILVEAVLGRELSQKFKLRFQQVGVTVLLLLMVFMVFNDLRGL
ncbi:MAG TPA: RIP metalloprotease RseP [Candidatus Kapabacteria bacterium]|nr:RIP metalloprotease RseP [Candidatus Kapabacteria bacterium]